MHHPNQLSWSARRFRWFASGLILACLAVGPAAQNVGAQVPVSPAVSASRASSMITQWGDAARGMVSPGDRRGRSPGTTIAGIAGLMPVAAGSLPHLAALGRARPRTITTAPSSPFEPANGTVAPDGLSHVSAVAPADAKLVLDHRTVGGAYDAGAGRLTYTAPRLLVPGVHLLQVLDADGTLESADSAFAVLPPRNVQPASSPLGNVDGQAWVRTSTHDGRYTLAKPASWTMTTAGGFEVVMAPGGAAAVLLSDRFLDVGVDALVIAHSIAGNIGQSRSLQRTAFFGDASNAYFVATMSGNTGAALTLINRVLPSPRQHSLVLGFGLAPIDDHTDFKVITQIESTLTPNDDASLPAARTWSHYNAPGLSLDYPADWLPDFGMVNSDSHSTTLMVLGASDQALLYVVGMAGQIAVGPVAAAARQVIAKNLLVIHPGLRIVASKSASGIYRWVATFPSVSSTSISIDTERDGVLGRSAATLSRAVERGVSRATGCVGAIEAGKRRGTARHSLCVFRVLTHPATGPLFRDEESDRAGQLLLR